MSILRRSWILTSLPLVAIALAGCDQMYDQATVRPYEKPQWLPASGTLPVAVTIVPEARAEAASLENPLAKTSETLAAGKLTYRRYCWPCHGPEFDGESSTVGPSFPEGNLNLLDPEIIGHSDGEYFWVLTYGTEYSPPFEGVMTREERWQVITYLRHVQAQRGP